VTTVNLVNPFWGNVVSAGPHQYWRLRGASTAQDLYMEIAVLAMAATPGGADQCTGGTAITGGVGGEVWDFADRAFGVPGNYAQGYNATGLNEAWIGYEFTAPVFVREIRITANVAVRGVRAGFIDASDDGVTWTVIGMIFDGSNYASAGDTKTFSILPIATSRATARVWGVDVYANGGGWSSIAELEFMTSAGGADLCVGGVPWASRATVGDVPFRGFDDDNGTFWQAGIGVVEGRLQYTFATAPNPTHMALRARSAALSDTPTAWRVQYTLDGITWTTVRDVSGETGWSASERRVYAL